MHPNPPRLPPGFIAEYVNEPRIRKGDVKMLPQSRSWQDADWKWLRKEFGNNIDKIYIEVRPARDGKWLAGLEQHFLADMLADAQKYAFGLLTDGTADSVWIAGRLVTYFGSKYEDRRVFDFAHYEKEEPMRRNARGGTLDETAADELKLYIDNTSELMGPRSQGESIRQNLLRKLKRGTFDLDRSVQLWMYLVESGAKLYAKEFAEPRDWNRMFSVPTRKAVARELAQEFYTEAKLGNYQLRANASRRMHAYEDQEEIHPEVAGFRFYDDDKTGMVVMVDEEGRVVYLVNPLEVPRGRSYAGVRSERPIVLWFGQIGVTRLFIWARSLEAALEEAGGVLADHFPGLIMQHDDPELKELYDEALGELADEGDGDEPDEGEVMEKAMADLTYTESGYIPSYEWGIDSDPGEGHEWREATEAGTAISRWLYRDEYGEDED